jgi:hypothetical protein
MDVFTLQMPLQQSLGSLQVWPLFRQQVLLAHVIPLQHSPGRQGSRTTDTQFWHLFSTQIVLQQSVSYVHVTPSATQHFPLTQLANPQHGSFPRHSVGLQ